MDYTGHGESHWPRKVTVSLQSETLTYETFFGLKEQPFSLDSDPRFLYRSPSHATTYENLLEGIRRRDGLLVLTGEIGIGKTTLCRAVIGSLGRKTFSCFVGNPFAAREDLLKMLLIDFGIISIQDLTTGALQHASRTELSYLLQEFLKSLALHDAYVVVIIDEAQNMSLPLIEETRILSDAFGDQGRLQIVFVGQPELHAKLKLPEMRQVDQRVCGYNRLQPLSREDVGAYVRHRLEVAGGSRERTLFGADVLDVLHRRTGGVPRLINRVCDRALQLAHRRQAGVVDLDVLNRALGDIGPTTLAPTWASIISAEVVTLQSEPVASGEQGSEAPLLEDEAGAPSPVTSTDRPYAGAAASGEEESFSTRVEHWMTHEVTPTLQETPTPVPGFTSVRESEPRPSSRRDAATLVGWHDTYGELRSETLLRRIGRVWARRAVAAAVAMMALSVGVSGATRLSLRLTGMMTEQIALPIPSAPVPAVHGIALPEAPPLDVPPPAVPRHYVAVGLFANHARAEELAADLTQAGLHALHRPFTLHGEAVTQVVLGPFANRSEAVSELERLREQQGGHLDALVFDAD